MRWVVIVIVLAGCGRLGYEPLPGSDLISGADGGATRDGAVAVDAGAGDAPGCPAMCTQGCADGTCHILGDDLDATGTTIRCPPGMPCRVTCMARQSCRTKIDCTGATSCAIDCVGDRSCFFGALCGAQPCDISCAGVNACGPIDCGPSPSCAVTCGGDDSCQFGIQCCGFAAVCDVACTGTGSCSGPVRCTSDPDCNDTCP